MDPGTALGIASLVLEACKTANELCRKFSDQRNQVDGLMIEGLEEDLKNLSIYSQQLKLLPLPPGGNRTVYISKHQEALKDLAESAATITDEILYILGALKPVNGQSLMQSFKKAYLSMARISQLKRLQDQFVSCRDKIQFHLIACLKEEFDQLKGISTNIYSKQMQLGEDMQKARDDIVNVLAVNDKKFQGTIMGLRDGGAFTINSVPSFNSDSTCDQTTGPAMAAFGSGLNQVGAQATSGSFQHIVDLVSQCLHFDRISDRETAIRPAHAVTFHWIFTDLGPEMSAKAFASFPKWLESGHGCYWISGKPGSGKSTLMKKIIESPMTKEHLQVWCGEKIPYMSSFFFWYLGSSLQKSREGMLRSLLSSLLEQASQIVLSAMPELLIEASKLAVGGSLGQPSIIQLQRWLIAFMKLCESSGNKVCFFIDGLDEYSGDKLELADMLLDLSGQTQAAKFVLASRPLSMFFTRFSKLPGLRVQDLTTSDVRNYTMSLLKKGCSLVSDAEIDSLNATISDRCQGVFLWVVVVVRSVLEGLCDGDTVDELRQRVMDLPTELIDLYRRMLESIGPRYQSEAAQMLLLAASALNDVSGINAIDPFPAIQFFFALEGCKTAMEAPIQPFSHEDVQSRIDKLETRLRSRCLGLIEFHDGGRTIEEEEKKLCSVIIEPFHRTAVEFLVDEDVSALLKTLAGPSFDPHQSLFCSIIRMAKIAPCFFPQPEHESALELPPWHHLTEAIALSVDAAKLGRVIQEIYLTEYDRVLGVHWSRWAATYAPVPYKSSEWLSFVLCDRKTAQGNWIPDIRNTHGIGHLSLDDKLCAQLLESYKEVGYIRMLTLTLYPRLLLDMLPVSPLPRKKIALIFCLFCALQFSAIPGMVAIQFEQAAAVILSAILDSGADPNSIDWRRPDRTIWMSFLTFLGDFLQSKGGIADPQQSSEALERVVRIFIDHGADLFVLIRLGSRLLTPSEYMLTLHKVTKDHVSKPQEAGVVDWKLRAIVDGLEAGALALAEAEEKARVYSRRSRAAHYLRTAPARHIERWTSRSKS